MTDQDQRFLEYMHDSIVLVREYTQGGRDAFMRDHMVQDAVLRRIETLADAAGRLSPELK